MLDSFLDPDFWRKQALTPEANAGFDVLTGQKSIDEAATDYTTSRISGNLLDSGADALHGATDNVDAAVSNVNPALNSTPEIVGPPRPPVNQAFPNDTSLSNQAHIRLNDNAIPGPQLDTYNGPTTSPANLPTPEEPATFLGLEGKDYTKMGMQGVMAAGVGALNKPTQQVQSAAPAGPGITKGTVMQPQGGMPGVNSMTQPVNSMQMTQAQGLISPFQRDLYRRRGY